MSQMELMHRARYGARGVTLRCPLGALLPPSPLHSPALWVKVFIEVPFRSTIEKNHWSELNLQPLS